MAISTCTFRMRGCLCWSELGAGDGDAAAIVPEPAKHGALSISSIEILRDTYNLRWPGLSDEESKKPQGLFQRSVTWQ